MTAAQAFAQSLGAVWAGGSDEMPPEPLDAAIIFAPVGALVPMALQGGEEGRPRRLRRHPHVGHSELSLSRSCGRSGRCVSVANLTRADAREFLALAPQAGVKTAGDALSARSRQRGACRSARRPPARRSRADTVRNRPPGRRPPAHGVCSPSLTTAWQRRLGMADHALDRREAQAQRALHVVDLLVHVRDVQRGIDAGSGN